MKFSSLFAYLILFNFITLNGQTDNSMELSEFLSQNNIEAQPIGEGMYLQLFKKGSGNPPVNGDYVMVRYSGSLLDGTVFDQSPKDEPFVFQLGYRQVIMGWERGIPNFQVGSKGKLYIPPDLAYGKRGVGKVIPPNASLIFEIELLEIMSIDAYDRYMVALEEKERKEFELQQREQFITDKKLIQQYSIDNELKSKRTDSGLSYLVTKKGKGDEAQPGDKLSVHYEGKLLDGTVFDSSFDGKPFSFVLGTGKVIQGWDEGLQYFRKGSEGILLIPSRLAYGPLPIEEDPIFIPGNSVLIFKIKVMDIEQATVQKR